MLFVPYLFSFNEYFIELNINYFTINYIVTIVSLNNKVSMHLLQHASHTTVGDVITQNVVLRLDIVGIVEFDGKHLTNGLSINNTQPFYLTKNSPPDLWSCILSTSCTQSVLSNIYVLRLYQPRCRCLLWCVGKAHFNHCPENPVNFFNAPTLLTDVCAVKLKVLRFENLSRIPVYRLKISLLSYDRNRKLRFTKN